MSWNHTRLAAGIAAALLLGGTALAQGAAGSSGATGTAPGGSTATGTSSATGGSDTASPSRSGTTGNTDATPTPSGSAATGTSTAAGSAHAGMASSGKLDRGLEVGLQKLHAANQAEIQMGQMATQTAKDEQVKQFAQKMVDDHQKNDQQLEQLAQQAGVTLQGSAFEKASKQSEKEMAKLHKPGASFDKAYMSHMVKDHQKDVREVGSLAKRAHREKQTELASFLDETHSTMQGHLKEAKSIAKETRSEQRQGRRGGMGMQHMGSGMHDGSGMGSGSSGMHGGSGMGSGAQGTENGSGSAGAAPAPSGTSDSEHQPVRP